jgi:hypothetical protein
VRIDGQQSLIAFRKAGVEKRAVLGDWTFDGPAAVMKIRPGNAKGN